MYLRFCMTDRHNPAHRQIHVRVDRRLLRQAKIRAAELDLTLTEWVRRALLAALDHEHEGTQPTNP